MKILNAVECIARIVGLVSMSAIALAACAAPASVDEDSTAEDTTASTSEAVTVSAPSDITVLFPGADGGPLHCGTHTGSFNMADQNGFGYRLQVDGVDAPYSASCNFIIVQSYGTALACIVDPVTRTPRLHAVNTIDYWFSWQDPMAPIFACEAPPIQQALVTPDRSVLLGTVNTIGQNRFLVTDTDIWSFGKSADGPHGSTLLRNGHRTGEIGVYNPAVDTTAVALEVANGGLLYARTDSASWYDWAQPEGYYGAYAWVPTSAPPAPRELF